jgi:hypothetical protein
MGAGAWMARYWRRTGPVLLVAIGVFLLWLVGTVILTS